MTGSFGQVAVTETVSGDVTLTTPSYPPVTSGQGTLSFTGHSVSGAPCSLTYTGSPGTLDATLEWPNLFSGEGASLQLHALDYDPEPGPSMFDLSCPESNPFFVDVWKSGFNLLHSASDLYGKSYRQTDFTLSSSGNPWAKGNSNLSNHSMGLTESTTFVITHTPD
jgi:hypothetical protein